MKKLEIIKSIPNFPFLEATIDGLSYYQLLAGLNAYIDEVVDNLNSIGGTNEQYKELKEKVDNINLILGNGELSTDSKTIISAINELSDTIKRIETAIGNDNLTTSADTIIGAINELVTNVTESKNNIGNINNLKTTNKNNIVSAINEIIVSLSAIISLKDNLKIQTFGRIGIITLADYNIPDENDIAVVLPGNLRPAYTTYSVITSNTGENTGSMFVTASTNMLFLRVKSNFGIYRGQLLYILAS